MKKLPRALNRILLFIFGLLFLAAGVSITAAASSASIHGRLIDYRSKIESGFTNLARQSTFQVQGREISAVHAGALALGIIVILLLIVWVFSQGGGKIRSLDIIESEVASSRDIASLKISSWEVKKRPGLALTAAVYKGTNPREVKIEIDQAIAKLDQVLGIKMPILVRITTNWRTNLGSADRVDS